MNPTLKSSQKFHCEICNYSTSRKSQYERHLATDKHKTLQNPIQKNFQKVKMTPLLRVVNIILMVLFVKNHILHQG